MIIYVHKLKVLVHHQPNLPASVYRLYQPVDEHKLPVHNILPSLQRTEATGSRVEQGDVIV
ncbi:Uncharacterised protein [Moraxella ovis]|uniref:Uncharacterized protein n=1 Tax=Moraxella ovis TaxID=29433 RepID=A0A378PKE2_9GAMM|nr:Uncharacterised protein [Moraxella ovis]STY86876.1 Uncharacterised protein [Moraxella ovis]STZ05226.1 Uncharacterised protein [Moraxella ovis]